MKEAEARLQFPDEDFVVMVHPDLEDSFTVVSVEALETVWAEKGWQAANFDVAPAQADSSPKAVGKPAKPEAESPQQ